MPVKNICLGFSKKKNHIESLRKTKLYRVRLIIVDVILYTEKKKEKRNKNDTTGFFAIAEGGKKIVIFKEFFFGICYKVKKKEKHCWLGIRKKNNEILIITLISTSLN